MAESYFECVLIDGEQINFGKRCNYIDEFGTDMIAFEARNFTNDDHILLQIIPKRQIRQIINNCPKEMFDRLYPTNTVEAVKIEDYMTKTYEYENFNEKKEDNTNG